MNNRLSWAVYSLVTASVVAGIWGVWLAFTNPDMTHARLVLTYWPHYVGMIALVAGAYLWAKWEMRR